MNKALLTVLVIVIVAGVFVEPGGALLRAGRDKIERTQRNQQMQQRETAEMGEVPYCILPGK